MDFSHALHGPLRYGASGITHGRAALSQGEPVVGRPALINFEQTAGVRLADNVPITGSGTSEAPGG